MRYAISFVSVLAALLACKSNKFSGNSNKGPVPAVATDTSKDQTPGGSSPGSTPGSTELPSVGSTIPGSDKTKEIQKACADGAAKLQSVTQAISYPERRDCAWNKAPNLDKKQDYVQASEAQSLTLNLPKGTLCDMDIQSPTNDAQLHYDDFLILTIDNHIVLASNKLLMKPLEQKEGVYNWDFTKVVGNKIEDFDGSPYCLGPEADCKLPVTDKPGPVQIKLSSQQIAPISAAITGKTSVPMNLVATGDNDDRDCYHTKLDLNVTIKYLP